MKRTARLFLLACLSMTLLASVGLTACGKSDSTADQKPVAGERSEQKDIETVHSGTTSAPGATGTYGASPGGK